MTYQPQPDSARPVRQDVFCRMASGRMVNLTHLTPDQIHWPDLVENLIKLPRFGGATFGITYTVAQHCCLMYDHADAEFKQQALLKDFHKAFLGEPTWPAQECVRAFSAATDDFSEAHALARDEIDDAIFRAARLPDVTEDPAEYAREQDYLAALSEKLMATERRDLLRPGPDHCPGGWKLAKPFTRTIRPWGTAKAQAELENRLTHIGICARG